MTPRLGHTAGAFSAAGRTPVGRATQSRSHDFAVWVAASSVPGGGRKRTSSPAVAASESLRWIVDGQPKEVTASNPRRHPQTPSSSSDRLKRDLGPCRSRGPESGGSRAVLGVHRGEVVLEDAGWGCPAECSVGSVVIVEMHEPGVGAGPLGF